MPVFCCASHLFQRLTRTPLLGLQVTSPKAGDVIDASQSFKITWTSGANDPSAISIYIGQNSTQFIRELAINVSVSAGSYVVPPIQGLVPDGTGYTIMLDPVSGGDEGASSGEITLIHSASSGTSVPTATTTVTAVSSASPTTTSSSSAPSDTATASTTQTSPSSSSNRKKTSHRLSSARKAGIGIGVAAAVILLAIVAFLLFRRRKQTREAAGDGENVPPVAEKASEPTTEGKEEDKPELPGNHEWPRAELPTARETAELSTEREAHELPA